MKNGSYILLMPNPPFPLPVYAIRSFPFSFVWGLLLFTASHTAAVALARETTQPRSAGPSRCADRVLVLFIGSDSTMAKVGA